MKVVRAVSKFDLFPALPTLRVEGEPEVTNFFGGLLSIVIFGVFLTIFSISVNSTINLKNISATQMSEMKTPQIDRISNITMAVALQWTNLVDVRNIFEFRAFIINERIQYRQIQTFPCQRDMWPEFSDEKYKTLRLQYAMCIQKQNVSIYGQSGANETNVLFLNLSICDNNTSPVTCATPQQIDYFFNNYLIQGKYIGCSVMILDTGINPTSENPVTHTSYQKTIWLIANRDQQILLHTFLGSYEINTDTNFLPFETIETVKGYFVDESIISTYVNTRHLPLLMDSFVFASPKNRVVIINPFSTIIFTILYLLIYYQSCLFNRRFGKIDDALSYVGGLYGIVISFFAFLMMSFNQYKYELRVSEGAFSFSDGHLAREKDLHFGKYVKYVAYDWIKTLFCCQLDWNECKAIDEARAEANEQIDVKHLLKRISHLQNVIQVISNSQISNAMCLIATSPIQTVQKKRNLLNYCQRISSQKLRSLTICDIQNMQLNQQSSIIMGESVNEKINNYSNSFINFNKTEMTEINMSSVSNKNSFQLIDEFVKKYKQKFTIENQVIELNQSQLAAEEELVQSFSSLNENQRIKIVKKIPLGILCRFNSYFCQGKRDCKIVQNEYKEDKNERTGQVKEVQMGLGELRVRKNGKIRSNLVKNAKV